MRGQLSIISCRLKVQDHFFGDSKLCPYITDEPSIVALENSSGVTQQPVKVAKGLASCMGQCQVRSAASKNLGNFIQKDLRCKRFTWNNPMSVDINRGAWSEQREARGCMEL
jgi:hypothetical protein